MRFDELFHDAAALDEPPIPPGVVGRVRRKQRTRRLALLSVGASLAVAAVVVIALTVVSGRSGPVPGMAGSTAPTAKAPPGTFFAILDHRAVEESPIQLQQDFGPAVAVSPTGSGAWVARSTAPCRSVIQLFNPAASTSFLPSGHVGDLAISPDGRQLAYSRGGSVTHETMMGGGCGTDALVIRDVRTGTERVWPGEMGGISSLSWSGDNRRLVFQTSICCDGTIDVKALEVSTAPTTISRVPTITTPGSMRNFLLHDPTFAGTELLLLADDPNASAEQYRVVTAEGHTVATLQDSAVSLDADASGQHMLVLLYGNGDTGGSLLSITRGQQPNVLGRGFAAARW